MIAPSTPARLPHSLPGYDIRPYAPGDLDAVHRCEVAQRSASPYSRFLLLQLADIVGDGFLVCEHPGFGVVGYIVAAPNAGDPSTGTVLASGLRPEYRNEGVASALEASAQSILASWGCEKLIAPSTIQSTPREEEPAHTSDGIRIKRYQPQDLVGVHSVETAVFGEESYPLAFLERVAAVAGEGFIVAEGPKGVVGYLIALVEGGRPERGWILSVAVAREHRGRGVGRRLTSEAESHLWDRRCEQVVLTVDPKNDAATALFEHRHYHQLTQHEDHHGLRLPRLVLQLHACLDAKD